MNGWKYKVTYFIVYEKDEDGQRKKGNIVVENQHPLLWCQDQAGTILLWWKKLTPEELTEVVEAL